MQLRFVVILIALGWGMLAHAEDYKIKVDVSQQGPVFHTQASFYLPLSVCQAYRYLTDYDAATQIPGVVASTSTRTDVNKVRVERLLQERILFFPIKMRMVLDVSELPQQGTDFVQISGEAKSYKGTWRLASPLIAQNPCPAAATR